MLGEGVQHQTDILVQFLFEFLIQDEYLNAVIKSRLVMNNRRGRYKIKMSYFRETAQSVRIDFTTHTLIKLESAFYKSQNITFKSLTQSHTSLTFLSDIIYD